jgi:phosphoglycerol transferase
MNPVPWLQMTNMISYQGLVRTFPKIFAASIFILISIAILFISFKYGNKLPHSKTPLFISLYILLLSIFIFKSNATQNIFNSLQNLSYGNGMKVAKQYNGIDYDMKNKYNYVFIYAESLERSLRNINGINYIPNISKLADQYLEFTDIQQIQGWTMAGMVNTQCAIPLVLPQEFSE